MPAPHDPTHTPSVPVVAVVVTWNRPDDVRRLVRALADAPTPLSLVVVDNASDTPIDNLHPVEHHLANASIDPANPAFSTDPAALPLDPHSSLQRLLIVRNTVNMGGCGGFLTGHHVARSLLADTPEAFLWLLDDDALPAQDCLGHLLNAMALDQRLGAVGSRMADPADPAHSLEGPVYFDTTSGLFQPAPAPDNPLYAHYVQWRSRIDNGDTDAAFHGIVPCDIMAACSLLCRWSAVCAVGFWDPRYFLAADDAEWCIRLRRHGYSVACCLDAVVFHEPWHRKRTPEREYYRRRNMLWLWLDHLPPETFLTLARARVQRMMQQSLRAIRRGNYRNAEIFRRTIDDAVASRGGRLDIAPPAGWLRRPRALVRWLRTRTAARRWLRTIAAKAQAAPSPPVQGQLAMNPSR
ncbi:MAG: glycosyltransferase family 2 protein [Phycisphaeraceae bacterium]|nr:glycosyltransferase family 2 protein [Phycisphaeraceae bacterium]